jgi:very-short-patch-repair endonuclease
MGSFIVDFVCHAARVVVEVDGATHSTDAEIGRDLRRDAWRASLGYVTIRVLNGDVYRNLDGVLEVIWATCAARTPLPNPPPQGGRESGRAVGTSDDIV